MNRRIAIQQLALLTGGLVLVPSCNFNQEGVLEAYDKLQITPTLKKRLASIADTIIPAGELKGAADIQTEDFILVMVNDCLDEKQQKAFTQGLKNFPKFVKNQASRAFEKLPVEEREELLMAGMDQKDHASDIHDFLHITKRFTVQGYMVSAYIMGEIKPYSLIPGTYQGEVLIDKLEDTPIYG